MHRIETINFFLMNILKTIWNQFGQRCPRLATEIQYLRRYRNYEPDLWAVPQFCDRSGVSIDVGVNMGIYSRWMAKHSERVESFECNTALHSHLKQFLPRNANLQPYALSDKSGSVSFRVDPKNTGIGTIDAANLLDQNPGIGEIVEQHVEARRLDEFGFEDVTFMKIDVEGHELSVLRGGHDLIQRCRPALLIELEERHHPGCLTAVPNWLAEFGYTPFIYENGLGMQEVTGDLQDHAESKYNFWFLTCDAKR